MKKSILRECLRIAKSKNNPETHPKFGNGRHHFTFIVQDNKIIEMGINREGPPLKTFGYEDYQGIHSENDAYKKAKGILGDKIFEAVNIRLNNQDSLRLAAPCRCCHEFLKILGCKTIWFSTNEGFSRI